MDLEKINKIAETVGNVIWPLILIALPIVTLVVMKQLKSKEAKQLFSTAIDTAYLVIHQVSRKTETKIDDKLEEALKVMKETLGRDLTVRETKEATVKLKAKHEARKFPNLLNIKEVGGFVGSILGLEKKKED